MVFYVVFSDILASFHMATLFTKEVRSTGNRRELYLYFQGRLLYKAWYVDNQKQYGRLFHIGEGLTLAAKATRHDEARQATDFIP